MGSWGEPWGMEGWDSWEGQEALGQTSGLKNRKGREITRGVCRRGG